MRPPLLLLVLVALVTLLPLGRLALTAVARPSGVWTEAATWNAALNSLLAAGCAAALAAVIGGGFTLLLALSDLRGRGLIGFLIMLPMMTPPQITALAWAQMLGPSSPLLNTLGVAPPPGSPNPVYSMTGIVLLLAVQTAPMAYLTLRAGLSSIPAGLVEAARLSGAGPRRVARDVILPLARPALAAGAAIAFTSAIGNFGVPAILGIPANITLLPTLIYIKLASFGGQTLGDLAHLSVLVALLAALGVAVQRRAGGAAARLTGGGAGATFALGRWRAPVEMLVWLLLVVALILPFLSLLAASLVPTYGVRLTLETVSLSAWRALAAQAAIRGAAVTSLGLASAAAVVLTLLALALCWRLDRGPKALYAVVIALIEMPYALPGVVIGVACVLLFAAPVLGVTIYGTIWIILFAYLCAYLAVAVKPVAAALAQSDPALDEAAALAGAAPLRRLRDIAAPLAAPAMGAAAILVFLIAVNELTVSALLWSAGTQTLGVMIFNLEDSGHSDIASALSVAIILGVLALMAALDGLSPRLPKGVPPWRL